MLFLCLRILDLLRRKLAFQSVVSVSVGSASESSYPSAQQDSHFCALEGLPAGAVAEYRENKGLQSVQFIAFIWGMKKL